MPWATRIASLSNQKGGLTAWVGASGLFAVSLAMRFVLAPYFDGIKFLTFYPAVVAAGLLYGWRQGLFVLVAATVSAWYWFIEPFNSFAFKDSNTAIQVIGFLIVGSFVLIMVAALRETVHRLDRARKMQEILFQDLQHRVANNLQLVVNLLRIAHRNLQDPVRAAETLDQAEARIMAMSQLHRRLHDGTAFADGLESALRAMLEICFKGLPVKVMLKIERSADLSIVQLTAIALLVNEAAMNSMKYVFSRNLGSEFRVALCSDEPGRLRLSIEDDGPGIAVDSETKDLPSLGMKIMDAFAIQLGGPLKILPGAGTRLSVDFPMR